MNRRIKQFTPCARRLDLRMCKKRLRVIGTTNDAITEAEAKLNFKFSASFRNWLVHNNGLGFESISIFPVFDERDPRKIWDSIVRNYNENWLAWLENFEGEDLRLEHLLPFAEFGTGDYYCFDYSKIELNGESPVVLWSHETGETVFRCKNFEEFLEKLKHSHFEFD